jgi:hypothetical protein
MVRIIDFKNIKQKNGIEFNLLVVQGGIEPLVSKTTGRIYFTMRKANVSTTFDAATCKTLMGTDLPGSIEKTDCDPYEYAVPETGEILTLKHSWRYVDNDVINAGAQVINEEMVN